MKKIVREPLFQFLFIALILLGGERLINADDYGDQQYNILVDDQQLLQFMQLQARMFRPEEARAALDGLSAADRQKLVDDYARSEALFREALALNLDKNDQVIRRRLIQKINYLAEGFADDLPTLTEEALRTYYQQRQQDYKKAASATFTHVFISSEQRSVEEARQMADQLLKKLNADKVPFENAPRYGERFLYNRNYVNREDDEIASHFGGGFQQQLFDYSVSDQWLGPLQSSYGWHLVMLVKNSPAYIPPFEEVASAVLADARRDQQQDIKSQTIDKLIGKYQVTDQGLEK